VDKQSILKCVHVSSSFGDDEKSKLHRVGKKKSVSSSGCAITNRCIDIVWESRIAAADVVVVVLE
jgi:hypothetical protein